MAPWVCCPSAMAALPAPADKLRASLEKKLVNPLFDELAGAAFRDDALPEVVLRHRRQRAYNRLLDALTSRGSATVPPELEREIRTLVRDWVATSFMDGFQAMDTFEIRCAEEHDLVVARESGDPDRLLEALENEHRNRVKKQFGELELRGIQTTHRVWQKLDEVYVPLHFEPVMEEQFQGIDGEVITLFARHRLGLADILTKRHVLIVGAPGSGKSTLVSYLATRAATGQIAEDLGWKESPLPFVLTVRALKKWSLTPKAIAEQVGCDIALVSRSLERQSMLLLVDGLDEAQEETRTRLIESLQRFVQRHPKVRLIATSRPAGPPGEIQGRLQGLHPFQLVELTKGEVDEYIAKWCLAAEQSIRKVFAEARKEASKAAEDLKRRLSESHSVQRIAVNPLLVTILCVVHRFLGRTIPEHRVTLYEKCTDALLYEWDRAKFEEGAAISYLDAPSKRRLLAGVARKIHQEHSAEISEKEVVQHFESVLPDLGRPAGDAKQIVAEIRDRSGLLVERRPGYFAFSHLTFQEYLCALDFVYAREFSGLTSHYQEPWWHEVIVLAAGMAGASNGVIPRKLLSKRRPAAVFLAAQCLDTEGDMPLEVRERIEKEIQKRVPPQSLEEARRLNALGIVAAPALVRSLPSSDETETLYTLMALDADYNPALPAIARCISRAWTPSEVMGGGVIKGTVNIKAILMLFHQADRSDAAKSLLRAALLNAHQQDLKIIRDHLHPLGRNPFSQEMYSILTHAIKVTSQENSGPKRARNTA